MDTRGSELIPLEEAVQQILRRAGCLADGRPVTAEELWQAAYTLPGAPLPPATLRLAPEACEVLARASTLARERSQRTLRRAELVEALCEARARAAGLDLARLRFVRWRLEQQYGAPLHARYSSLTVD